MMALVYETSLNREAEGQERVSHLSFTWSRESAGVKWSKMISKASSNSKREKGEGCAASSSFCANPPAASHSPHSALLFHLEENTLHCAFLGKRRDACYTTSRHIGRTKGTTSVMSSSNMPTEHLQGIVERVTYHAEDSGYTVARLKAPGERDLITIVGRFPDIHAGQTLRLTGYWREHLKYGRQFQCLHAQETKPATLTGVEKYLGSGLIKGIGPVTARRIVAHFGLETLDIIEHACTRLIEVTGIGEKRVAMIERAWAAQQAIKEVMLFLRGHNVSTTYAVKIYKEYGDQAIDVVSKNPYQLATDIFGIGFVTADTIARNIGIAPDSDFRYQAGMLYVLQQAAEEGHCFLPEQELTERVVKRLALPDSPVDPVRIGELISQMAKEKTTYYATRLWRPRRPAPVLRAYVLLHGAGPGLAPGRLCQSAGCGRSHTRAALD